MTRAETVDQMKKLLILVAGIIIGAIVYYSVNYLWFRKLTILNIKVTTPANREFFLSYETFGEICIPIRHGRYIPTKNQNMTLLASFEVGIPLSQKQEKQNLSKFKIDYSISTTWLLFKTSNNELYLKENREDNWITVPFANRGIDNLIKVFKGEKLKHKKNDYAFILTGADYLATLATKPLRL